MDYEYIEIKCPNCGTNDVITSLTGSYFTMGLFLLVVGFVLTFIHPIFILMLISGAFLIVIWTPLFYFLADHSSKCNNCGHTFNKDEIKYNKYRRGNWIITVENTLNFKRLYSYIAVYYNRIRIHSTLDYKSPEDYEKEVKLSKLFA